MAAEYLKAMGAQIRAAMDAKGMTQNELARAVEELRKRDNPQAANIDPSSISRYVRGKVEPNPSMKQYLADALGITVAQLMGPEPDKSETPDLSLEQVRVEFRGDVDGVQEQLDRIEKRLEALRVDLSSEIGEQLDIQMRVLKRIEELTGVLEGAVVEEPAAAEGRRELPAVAPGPATARALAQAEQRLSETSDRARSRRRQQRKPA